MYEHFEHTADLGLRVVAEDLDRLFEDAGRGLMAMIVEELLPGEGQPVEIHVPGRRHDWLLFDWLNELLYRFETQRQLLGDFKVSVGAEGLTAHAMAQPLDVDRHRLLHEVKAITYHHLSVEHTAAGWQAEVIVDI